MVGQYLLHAGFLQCNAEPKGAGPRERYFHKLVDPGHIHFLCRLVLYAFHEVEHEIGILLLEIVDKAVKLAVDVKNLCRISQGRQRTFDILHLLHHTDFREIDEGLGREGLAVARAEAEHSGGGLVILFIRRNEFLPRSGPDGGFIIKDGDSFPACHGQSAHFLWQPYAGTMEDGAAIAQPHLELRRLLLFGDLCGSSHS